MAMVFTRRREVLDSQRMVQAVAPMVTLYHLQGELLVSSWLKSKGKEVVTAYQQYTRTRATVPRVADMLPVTQARPPSTRRMRVRTIIP